MSISSCPRCAKQVTLPIGVSNEAKVRCPLCHAQYPLSEALVTMPPLLELIEDAPADALDDGHDLASERGAEDSTLAAGMHHGEFPGASAAADNASHPDEPDEALEFEAFEIEHDDLVMQEQDTEVEDVGFATSEPLVRAVPDEVEHLEIAGPDEESVLDLGQSTETLEFTEQVAVGDELELDFGQPQDAAETTASDPGEIDFGQPRPVEAGEEIEIDFGEMQDPAAASPAETIDFRQPSPSQPAADDEIGLDFGEPVAAPAAKETQQAKVGPAGKQDKKEKPEPKKKPRPAKSGSQRSLVGRLMIVVLSGLFAVPLAYYAGLWISPDYDILKIAGKLPAFMAPPGAKRPSATAQVMPNMPPQLPPQLPPQSPVADDTAFRSSAPPPEPTEADAKGTPADEAPPSPPVEPAASEQPVETPSDGPPDPTPADKDLPEPPLPAADATGPEPEEMPAEPVGSARDESAAKDAPSTEDKPEAEPADPVTDLISPGGEKPEDVPAEETPEDMPAEAKDSAVPGPFDDVADAKSGDAPTEATEPAEALGPRNARAFTPADLAKALQEVSRANEKMTAAQNANDDAEIKKVRAGFYLSLYGLADVLTFAKTDQHDSQIDAQRQGLRQVVLQLAADPQRLKAVKANAAKWFRYTKRTTPGIMLAGTVQSVEPMGKLYQIQLRVTADSPVVTVISAADPRLQPDDEAFALGSIVEDPGQELAGYEGDAAAIVWSGMTLKLPPEAN